MTDNKTANGAYVADCDTPRQVTLLASGSEVAIALDAQSNLAAAGIAAAAVSVPCLDLFAAQSDAYRDTVLGTAPALSSRPESGKAGSGCCATMITLSA